MNCHLHENINSIRSELLDRLEGEGIKSNHIKSDPSHVFLKLEHSEKETDITNIVKAIDGSLEVNCTTDNSCIINYSKLGDLKRVLLSKSISAIQRRVDESGIHEVLIQSQGDDGIVIQVPGVNDPEQLKALIGKVAKLSFHLLDNKENATFMKSKSGILYPVKRKVELTGDLLTDASVVFNKFSVPAITFKFNNIGAKKFAKISKENIGKPFAIVLDDQVLTVPVIREAILTGRGEISGQFTIEEAQELAVLLRSGALPAPLDIVEEHVIGPTLGSDAISAGIEASVFSIITISSFMIFMYGILGLCAAIALVMNMIIMFGCLTFIGATLTLPGMAGIVLTIGMAVDANVLIFERIKEELQRTKKLKTAISKGFRNAMTTILDSNITTLIAALIMFYIGLGPIKGFAITLLTGVLSSMFASIMITRQIVNFVARLTPKLFLQNYRR